MKISWGIIGAGDVCERKSGSPFFQLENSQLISVHRRNAEKGRDFAARHGNAEYVDDPHAFFNDERIQAVYVATPHHLHREHTITALEAGKHVLVEKPMALSSTDCRHMADAAKAAGRVLGVAYYRRGYPSVQMIRDMIRNGRIGELQRVSICNEFPSSHRVDLARFICGPIVSWRIDENPFGSWDPESMQTRAYLTSESGAEVTMALQWTETGMSESMYFEGSQGSIFLSDLKAGYMELRENGSRQQIECGSQSFTHWNLIDNFNHHLIDGTPLLCDATEGYEATRLIEEISRAVK